MAISRAPHSVALIAEEEGGVLVYEVDGLYTQRFGRSEMANMSNIDKLKCVLSDRGDIRSADWENDSFATLKQKTDATLTF